MHEEEGALDVSRGNSKRTGKGPYQSQETFPLSSGKVRASRVAVNGAEVVQELPDPNVDHSVSLRIEHREYGGGGGNRYAMQHQESVHPLRFAGRRERGRRCLPDAVVIVQPDQA